ncbi:unnamed protein product [Mytilus edulis]|uniref:Uncharacterized protein n=1 Tax=Mytilus edulis TaxID=6550 RepID=A0A8S3RHH4_MYTED|nr:unnamed protein product [Mytilus edulis]
MLDSLPLSAGNVDFTARSSSRCCPIGIFDFVKSSGRRQESASMESYPSLINSACPNVHSLFAGRPLFDRSMSDNCSQEIRNLPSLGSNMNCYIDQSCTAVQCCIDVNELGQSIEIGVEIDPCDFMLTVRIEKLNFDVTLYDYIWDCAMNSSLPMLPSDVSCFITDTCTGIQCCVINTLLQQTFEISFLLDSCCANNINLLQIPEPTSCYLDTSCTKVECCVDVDFIPYSFHTYLDIDPCRQMFYYFFLADWLQTKEMSLPLPDYGQLLLFEDVGIAPYLQDDQLCAGDVDLPVLSEDLTCYLGDTCDTVSCCVDVEDLGRTMEISLSIDHCNMKLTLQLERLSEEISLVDYKWSKSWNEKSVN